MLSPLPAHSTPNPCSPHKKRFVGSQVLRTVTSLTEGNRNDLNPRRKASRAIILTGGFTVGLVRRQLCRGSAPYHESLSPSARN